MNKRRLWHREIDCKICRMVRGVLTENMVEPKSSSQRSSRATSFRSSASQSITISSRTTSFRSCFTSSKTKDAPPHHPQGKRRQAARNTTPPQRRRGTQQVQQGKRRTAAPSPKRGSICLSREICHLLVACVPTLGRKQRRQRCPRTHDLMASGAVAEDRTW